jgi:hypothetical protein
MISIRSFQKMSVPEIINQCQQQIQSYKRGDDPAILRDVVDSLAEGERILRHALISAGANDRKRIMSITSLQQKINELFREVKKL